MASNDQKTELFFKTFNNTVNADQIQSFAALDNKYPFGGGLFTTFFNIINYIYLF